MFMPIEGLWERLQPRMILPIEGLWERLFVQGCTYIAEDRMSESDEAANKFPTVPNSFVGAALAANV